MRRRGTVLATVCLLVASPLHAQQFSLRLGGLRTQYADTLEAGAGSVAAQVAWAGTRSSGAFEASWSQFNTGNGAGQIWGNVAAMGPHSRHAGIGVRADGVTNVIAGSSWTATGTTELFGALAGGGWSVALGLNAGGVRSIDTARFATAGASLRTWFERGAWSVGAALSTTTSKYLVFTDVTASADYRRGRVTLGALMAAREGDLTGRPWYQGRASLRLTPVVSLETASGSYPKDLAGYDHGRFATVGLRIRLGAPPHVTEMPGLAMARAVNRVRVESLDATSTRVTFELAADAAPSIVGSWNAWTPAALTPSGPNRWSVVLPIGPGSFRFALVLADGRWIIPDGVTRLPDDFDGEVGILVVGR